MQTCRHFRYQVPREVADELRDADPEPCAVCDAMPHRQSLAAEAVQRPLPRAIAVEASCDQPIAALRPAF